MVLQMIIILLICSWALPEAIQIANDYGNRDLQSMIRDIKTKIDELVQSQKENMVMIYNQHPYWVNRDPEADDDKIIRRALTSAAGYW
ncbi:MAG: hypothetical protein ACLU6Y_13490 [Ruminococcus sp.]